MKKLFGKLFNKKQKIKELENKLEVMENKVALIKQALNSYVLVVKLPKEKYKQAEVVEILGEVRSRMVEEAVSICDNILGA